MTECEYHDTLTFGCFFNSMNTGCTNKGGNLHQSGIGHTDGVTAPIRMFIWGGRMCRWWLLCAVNGVVMKRLWMSSTPGPIKNKND